MTHSACYDDKSACPKCGSDQAGVEHVRYLPEDREVILRKCIVCGYVRVELPLDDPHCVNTP